MNEPQCRVTITLSVLFMSTAMKVEERFYCAIKRGFIFLDKFVHVFNSNSKCSANIGRNASCWAFGFPVHPSFIFVWFWPTLERPNDCSEYLQCGLAAMLDHRRTDRRQELYRKPENLQSVLSWLAQAVECDWQTCKLPRVPEGWPQYVSIRSVRGRMWGCSCLYALKLNLTSYFAVLFKMLQLIACNLKMSYICILYKTVYIYIYINKYMHKERKFQIFTNVYSFPPCFSWAWIKSQHNVFRELCTVLLWK